MCMYMYICMYMLCMLYWILNSGSLAFSSPVLYHLSHTPRPFHFGYFWNKISLYVWDGLRHNTSLCFLHNVDDSHTPPCKTLIGWDEVLLNFCLGWLQTMILLISASQVARHSILKLQLSLGDLSQSLFLICVNSINYLLILFFVSLIVLHESNIFAYLDYCLVPITE
jgi:hypothetical protein